MAGLHGSAIPRETGWSFGSHRESIRRLKNRCRWNRLAIHNLPSIKVDIVLDRFSLWRSILPCRVTVIDEAGDFDVAWYSENLLHLRLASGRGGAVDCQAGSEPECVSCKHQVLDRWQYACVLYLLALA